MTKKITLALFVIMSVLLSSCGMPYRGQQPAVTASPTGRFAATLPGGGMGMVESFGTGTAQALTAAAGGAPNTGVTPTPGTGTTGTPGAAATTAVVPPQITFTPQIGGVATTAVVPAATTAVVPAATTAVPPTAVPAGFRPASYTLHEGEFPYCIARRYNVDPTELLSMSGLSDGVMYSAGTVLRIPQSGSFPGDLALRPHPTTYTVTSSDETFYSIACLFGNVTPEAIAAANGMSVDAALPVGKVLSIP